MIDNKMTRPNLTERPEEPKQEAMGQQLQQSQSSAAATPGQRMAPGRKPLFGR
jgi:hypothetical protein